MKITRDIIRGVLRGTFSDDEPIIHLGMTYQLRDIVSRLTLGLNDIIARGNHMEFLKREQVRIDADHIEATCELETQMVGLQEECPHFSHTITEIPFTPEVALELGKSMSVPICDICGKILEEEINCDIP